MQNMMAHLSDGKDSKWRTRGHGPSSLEFSLPAGKKRLSAAEKHPFDVENLFSVRGLGTILPSCRQRNFVPPAGDWQRNLAYGYLLIQHVNSHHN
jgi:hypothetical protein